MPSVSAETLEQLERLCKVYKIEFIDNLPHSQWPTRLQRIQSDVADLGTRKFDEYATSPTSAEWKLKAKAVAEHLVSEVRRQRQRNESTWRHACEPIVFARMKLEVAW